MRYEIQGETLPVVICYLDGGEKMITEGGGMSWMSPNMKMETTTNGGIGKAFGRMFSGERLKSDRDRRWYFRRVHSLQVRQEWNCQYSLIRNSVRDYSAEKDLSCRK